MLVDNDGTQTVTANTLVDLGSIINSTGTSITFTSPNVVNLGVGTYILLFESLISNTSSDSGDVGASMLVNGTVVPNASEYTPATTTQSQFVLMHSLTVTAATTVSIRNGSSVSNQYHDTSLLILKIA